MPSILDSKVYTTVIIINDLICNIIRYIDKYKTIIQLKYIVALDTYRHFSLAAEHAFVSQPTLSMQLQKAEDELGMRIFDRSKQPHIPTENGLEVIEQARKILAEYEVLDHLASFKRATSPVNSG